MGPTVQERRKLTAVARGAAPADLYVRGGTLLNVYTGELHPAGVAVAGERIAYVGAREDMLGARTEVLDAEGRLRVTSQATRDQARNVEDARDKVRALVAAALVEPRPRRKTRPTAAARERRIEAKKRRAALKRGRARPEE